MNKTTQRPGDTPRAVLLLIGNELLSGEIADENLPFISQSLFSWGAELRYVHVIRDDLDLVAAEIRAGLEAGDWVITTGGIGATPDDITRAAVAKALGVPLAPHPEAERELRAYYGEYINDVRLSLARIPEGAEIIHNPVNRIPTFRAGRVIVLPGIPSLVRAMFPSQKSVLSGTPYLKHQMETLVGESRLAATLTQAEREFPAVAFGSYPDIDSRPMRVRLVLRSKDREQVDAARAWLAEKVAKIERNL